MQDEALTAPRPVRAHTRVRHGLRHPHNWYQLVKFCVVGGSGYVVNLFVFTLCVKPLSMHHLVAATCAFNARKSHSTRPLYFA